MQPRTHTHVHAPALYAAHRKYPPPKMVCRRMPCGSLSPLTRLLGSSRLPYHFGCSVRSSVIRATFPYTNASSRALRSIFLLLHGANAKNSALRIGLNLLDASLALFGQPKDRLHLRNAPSSPVPTTFSKTPGQFTENSYRTCDLRCCV